MDIKAAIFDMDGVLFDTEVLYQECWHELAAEHGVTLDDGFKKAICGTSGELMRRVIEKYYHVADSTKIIEGCQSKLNEKLSRNVPMKPGVREILEAFRAHNMKIAVASSSRRSRIENNLDKSGLACYFDEIVCGSDVANGKPAPDIFIAAANALGYDPKECYVFEDSANGVKAGHAAGSFVIMVPDQIQPDEETTACCDKICDNLLEAKYFIFNE